MGFMQSDRHEDQDRLMAHFNSAAGETWRTGAAGIWYAMIEAEAELGQDFKAGYAVGGGPSLGLIQSITRSWKIVAQARALYMGIGDEFWTEQFSIDQDYRLRRNVSVGFDLMHKRVDTTNTDEAQLRLNYYF
jgi:hypothetical protein